MVRGCALGALILFVSYGAAAQEIRKVPKAVACNNDDETCRENCTIEFGSSFRTRAKLGQCMETCRTRHQRCTEQWTELHQHNLDAQTETKPAATVTQDVVDEVPELPPPSPEEAPVEEETRPYNEGITIPSDEQLAGPTPPEEKPVKKKVEAPKPKPPPPPEKKVEEKKTEKKKDYDISEWDPDEE